MLLVFLSGRLKCTNWRTLIRKRVKSRGHVFINGAATSGDNSSFETASIWQFQRDLITEIISNHSHLLGIDYVICLSESVRGWQMLWFVALPVDAFCSTAADKDREACFLYRQPTEHCHCIKLTIQFCVCETLTCSTWLPEDSHKDVWLLRLWIKWEDLGKVKQKAKSK